MVDMLCEPQVICCTRCDPHAVLTLHVLCELQSVRFARYSPHAVKTIHMLSYLQSMCCMNYSPYAFSLELAPRSRGAGWVTIFGLPWWKAMVPLGMASAADVQLQV